MYAFNLLIYIVLVLCTQLSYTVHIGYKHINIIGTSTYIKYHITYMNTVQDANFKRYRR